MSRVNPIASYYHWLHGRWPAGKVEKAPEINDDGSTNVSGVYVVGDLTGIPLLKFSSDTGARVVRVIDEDPGLEKGAGGEGVVDVAIIGAGVSGVAAAMEASKRGLSYTLYEAKQAFSTVIDFPKGKPIFTYPTDMTPEGDLQFTADVKEALVEELEGYRKEYGIETTEAQIEKITRKGGALELQIADGENRRAQRVIVAIGRSGNYRALSVPGEELDKVHHRLHDPKDYCDKKVLVVGGGDSAMETAIALGNCGSEVVLSYRKVEFSRPKPENVERLKALAEGGAGGGSVELLMASTVREIRDGEVVLETADGEERTVKNDAVFAMIGREAPLDFFRRSGVRLSQEWNAKFWGTLAAVLAAFTVVYQWKKGGTWLPINEFFQDRSWFPFNVGEWWNSLGGVFSDPAHLFGTLKFTAGDPGFYYSLLYSTLIVVFGIRRIQMRRTPYITKQTTTLVLVQVVPLFLVPYILLPWAGFNGWFDAGVGKSIADELFPQVNYGSGREYWRAFGLVLAWPLFIWNVFTSQPMWGWLIISLVQTFVIIPLIIYRWGKGAYCGFICSCGAMAETLGDSHRQKMPHGPMWNKMNMIGQAFLVFALLILFARVLSWIWPDSPFQTMFALGLNGSTTGEVMPWSYAWFVDLLFAGIIGFGMYFHFSGRVWCRFACPLAALMHIYARFTQFRIFADKKKCISCNVCTSNCHQGIDVMSFANKGEPMADPECVRCSACVQTCPTGVLQFGRYAAGGEIVLDQTAASPVLMAEKKG